jgi:hypothetical protein
VLDTFDWRLKFTTQFYQGWILDVVQYTEPKTNNRRHCRGVSSCSTYISELSRSKRTYLNLAPNLFSKTMETCERTFPLSLISCKTCTYVLYSGWQSFKSSAQILPPWDQPFYSFSFQSINETFATNTSPHSIHTQAEPASNNFRTKERTIKWIHSHCANFEIPSITAGPLAHHHTQPTSSISFILHEQKTLPLDEPTAIITSTVAGKLYTPNAFIH